MKTSNNSALLGIIATCCIVLTILCGSWIFVYFIDRQEAREEVEKAKVDIKQAYEQAASDIGRVHDAAKAQQRENGFIDAQGDDFISAQSQARKTLSRNGYLKPDKCTVRRNRDEWRVMGVVTDPSGKLVPFEIEYETRSSGNSRIWRVTSASADGFPLDK